MLINSVAFLASLKILSAVLNDAFLPEGVVI
jgi:hypothetical protein